MDAVVSRRQNLTWLILIVLGAIVVGLRSERSGGDLRGFHQVWAANWQQPSVENRPDREDPYAPSFYVIFAPLGALPLWVAAVVIYAVNVTCVWGIVRLTVRLLNLAQPRLRELWIPALAVTPFLIGTISLGQNTLVLMLLVLAAYWVSRQRRDWLAGGLIGLATAIKVYPLIFLAPYLFRLRYQVIFSCALTIALIAGGLGTMFFGFETNVAWHTQWAKFLTRAEQDRPENPFYPRSLRCTARYNNQAVAAVLARVMLDVPAKWYGKTFKVNVFEFDSATWRTARSAAWWLFLGVGTLALWGLQSGSSGPGPSVRELALVCAWFFVISPMVWTHYLLWAFFPLAMLVIQRDAQPRTAKIILAVWFLAELFVWSKVSRAIGINLIANIALFTWAAWPGLAVVANTLQDWMCFSTNEEESSKQPVLQSPFRRNRVIP